jgi:hypothetical protein
MPDTRDFVGGAAVGRAPGKTAHEEVTFTPIASGEEVKLRGAPRPEAEVAADPVAATLMAAAALRGERAGAYGDAPQRSALAVTALFPQGITLQSARDQQRFFLLRMVTAKLARYAVKFWGRDEDSLKDAINYLAMLDALDRGDDLGDMPF